MDELSVYRGEIDEIDGALIPLFERRMELARQVAAYKRAHNLPVLQSGREEEVLEKAQSALINREYAPQARQLMRTLMELSRAAQHRDLAGAEKDLPACGPDFSGRIGYPGVEGSFSEQALIEFFGREGTAYPDFDDVFVALGKGEIDYAILPIENSSTGSIAKNYDLLDVYGFFIVGEHVLKISQNLVGVTDASIDTVKTVYSHVQGIEQSAKFLADHRHWETVHFLNTSVSAKMVAESGDPTKAAIASQRAAQLYGLKILAADIQDSKTNSTRFMVVAKRLMEAGGNKISVSFTLDNESGTLYSVLRHFAQGRINMVKIESRPIPKELWNYRFYLDFEGNLQSPEVAALLESLARETKAFRLLGAYRRGERIT